MSVEPEETAFNASDAIFEVELLNGDENAPPALFLCSTIGVVELKAFALKGRRYTGGSILNGADIRAPNSDRPIDLLNMALCC